MGHHRIVRGRMLVGWWWRCCQGLSLAPGCKFGTFNNLLFDLRSYGFRERYVMPRQATVNDCTPRKESQKEEPDDASNGGKDDDGHALVCVARRRIERERIMRGSQPDGGFRR